MTDDAACPSWCVTDHGKYRFHGSGHAAVPAAGYRTLSVRVIQHPGPGLRPEVQVAGNGIVSVPSGGAAALAALVEELAGATPEEHRRLGAAIRAAAQLAGEAPDSMAGERGEEDGND